MQENGSLGQPKDYGSVEITLPKGEKEEWKIIDSYNFEDGDKNVTFSNGTANLTVLLKKGEGEKELINEIDTRVKQYYETIAERRETNKKRDQQSELKEGKRDEKEITEPVVFVSKPPKNEEGGPKKKIPLTKGNLNAIAQFIKNGGVPEGDQATLYAQHQEKIDAKVAELKGVKNTEEEKSEPPRNLPQSPAVSVRTPAETPREEIVAETKGIEKKEETSDNLNTTIKTSKKSTMPSLEKKPAESSNKSARVGKSYKASPAVEKVEIKKSGFALPEEVTWPTNDFKKHTWTKISELPEGGFLYELNDKEKTQKKVTNQETFDSLREIIKEKFTLSEKKSEEALTRARKKNGIKETKEFEKKELIEKPEPTYEKRVGVIDQKIQEILKDKVVKKQILEIFNRTKKEGLIVATHGMEFTNKITTETGVVPTTDLDGKLTAYLLGEALGKEKIKEQQFTEKGVVIDEKTKNKADIYFDTAEQGKIISLVKDEETGKTHLVFGNHFDGRNTKTSSAAILYSLLNQLDKLPTELKKSRKLKEFIAFNNDTDNLIIPSPILRDYKAGLSQTLYGHYRDLPFNTIKEHFLSGKTALDPLDQKVLSEKIQYKERTITREEMLLERIRGSEIGVKKAEEEMAKNKMPTETLELGKVLINERKESPISMRELAKIRGYDATVTLNEKGAFVSRPGVNIEEFGRKLQKTFPEVKVVNSMILFYPTKTTFNKHAFLEALNLVETNKLDKKDTQAKENRAILVNRLIQDDLGWKKEMINHLSDEKLQELIRNKEKPTTGNLKWETVRGTALPSSVTEKEFEEFQKTGKVSLGTLEQIALKFSRNQMLDSQEVSILSSYQKQIEGLAKNAEKRLAIDLQIEEIRKRKEVFAHNKEVLLERIRLAKEQLAKLKGVPIEPKKEEVIAPQTESTEPEHTPGDYEKVAALAEKLKKGETPTDAESLQLQANYPKLLEKLLNEKVKEKEETKSQPEEIGAETNEQEENNEEKDLETARGLRLDFIKIQISQNISAEEKLQVVKEFFSKNFGWNISTIETRKEDNGLEMTIDGKKVSLPKNAGLTFMDGKPALTFTMEDVIKAKYEVL